MMHIPIRSTRSQSSTHFLHFTGLVFGAASLLWASGSLAKSPDLVALADQGSWTKMHTLIEQTGSQNTVERANKKLAKLGLGDLTLPLASGPGLPNGLQPKALIGCVWNGHVQCAIEPALTPSNLDQSLEFHCASSTNASFRLPLIKQTGSDRYAVEGIERCWNFDAATFTLQAILVEEDLGPPVEFGHETVEAVIRKRKSVIRNCYQKAQALNPTLRGNVTIAFAVAQDGNVSSAAIESASLPDDEVLECIRRQFQSLVFPRPVNGSYRGTYPFNFVP